MNIYRCLFSKTPVRFWLTAERSFASLGVLSPRTLSIRNLRFLPTRFILSMSPSEISSVDVIAQRYDNIIKSKEDKREYRGLELTNGLRVLLISDPKTDKSAASMDVNVGHLMDPWNLPGLAHFCEHMLFLGTDKYPSENEYSKFISSHGGITNAYTATDHTNYHFDIAPEHLHGALDRFVQFFLCPQFTESATEREVRAVDSEFSNSLFNDQWRMLQVERSLSKPSHDYGKFGTGNRTTLMVEALKNGIEPRKALLEFHKTYYSSDIMSFAILGKESLDQLEQMVTSLSFGNIEKKNVSRKIWNEGPYGEEQLGVKVELVPVKDLRYLTLTFPVRDYRDDYRSWPAHYVSHLIGHEGPGSLLSELKRRGWVNSLSAGDRLLARGFGNFSVSVDLSEEGLLHTDDIVKLVFSEVGLVKQTGPLKWIFDELKQLQEIKFRFKDKESPLNYVTQISSELQRIPFEDIICADYRMDLYKPDLIKEFVEEIKPENMLYAIISQEYAGKEDNIKEKWYGTEYSSTKIDKKVLSKFNEALTQIPDFLSLPAKNEYIATKFDLKPREETKKIPYLVVNNDWCRLWFMQDNDFKLPKLCTRIAFKSPMMHSDPLNSYLSAMFVICLQDAISEETYNAHLAGLKSSFDLQSYGITLHVSGYDEKQPKYINDLIQRFITFVPDEERYKVLKETFCRNLRNFRQSQPYMQAHYYSTLLLGSRQWSKEEVLACAENCEVGKLRKFAHESLQALQIEALVYGNSTEKESAKILDDVVSKFKALPDVRHLFESELDQCREHEIPKGCQYVYKAFQPTHPNASVNYLMQTGKQDTRENVLLELIVQLAAEPAFNQLRTTEQLGYIVHTGARRSNGVQGIELLIQGQHIPEFMVERIENFLVKFRSDLEKMSDDEFLDNVEALATKRLEKPKTMKAQAGRYWAEVDIGFYLFERNDIEVPILRKLTKADVIEYFDKHFAVNSSERRKLCAMVYANTETEDTVSKRERDASGDAEQLPERITNIKIFKSRLSLYPLPQPAVDINQHISREQNDANKQ
uniref:Insulin-degrading enzyme n=2 Tax=Wuchereria bancrofti TaxID=6293 RepID=A0AAF5PUE9_WUCBA